MGRDVWPATPVFRIVTRSGDDFFVDVTRTQFTFKNELGRFKPYLSEITRMEPLDQENTTWRILLSGGMVFNAAIADATRVLRAGRLRPNISRERLIRHAKVWPALVPGLLEEGLAALESLVTQSDRARAAGAERG